MTVSHHTCKWNDCTITRGFNDQGALCFLGFTADPHVINRYYPKAVLKYDEKTPDWQSAHALYVEGTDFQVAVWKHLLKIPSGSTRTYAEVARNLGYPNGARAVGGAVGANPVSLVIPCHRIVHTSGKTTGYAWGPDIKRKILKKESRHRG